MKELRLVLDFVRKPQPEHPNRFQVSEHGYLALRRESAEERELREAWEAADTERRQ